MNKKANTYVTLFTIMVLLLCAAIAVMLYIDAKKVSTWINNGRCVEAVYVKEAKANFYLKEGIASTYEEAAELVNGVATNGKIMVGQYCSDGIYIRYDFVPNTA